MAVVNAAETAGEQSTGQLQVTSALDYTGCCQGIFGWHVSTLNVHVLIFLPIFSVEGSRKEEEPSELSLQTCVLHAMDSTGTV